MSSIIFNIYCIICQFCGGAYDVSWLGITQAEVGDFGSITASVDGETGIIGDIWLGPYAGCAYSDASASYGIISQFVSCIVNNPLILMFVLIALTFIGIKLLRRLCDV